MLACHDDIATIAECWILLPIVHMFREEGVRAQYNHEYAVHAIREETCFLNSKGEKTSFSATVGR